MDEETLARAVEPFYTTKGVGKGTGLGLSMVQGLMEQSGGKLALRSSLNQGTTVELWLPIADGEAADSTLPELETAPDLMASEKLTILAVDDDVLVLMNTVAMLEDLGHRVHEASSGSEAFAAVRDHPEIDLVITDYAMPGMTGLQLAEQLEALRPDLPIVLASGYSDLPNGAHTELTRLPKPFLQQDLQSVIASVLSSR